jgi:hypothetical protein
MAEEAVAEEAAPPVRKKRMSGRSWCCSSFFR